jgi:hemerythrin-like metal-binding protein
MILKPNAPKGPAAGPETALATRLVHLEGEHARIIGMLENAIQALAHQASPSEVNAILLELNGYALNHFREEEELMRFCAFPGHEAHKEEHNRLAAYARGLLDMTAKQEALRCAVGALDLWLSAHIHLKDNEFSEFLQRKTKIS